VTPQKPFSAHGVSLKQDEASPRSARTFALGSNFKGGSEKFSNNNFKMDSEKGNSVERVRDLYSIPEASANEGSKPNSYLEQQVVLARQPES
jgi:hypothetical protein